VPTTAEFTAQAQQVIARCRELAQFTEDPPRITRMFLSPPMRDCHKQIAEWMHALGMAVTIDPIGNLRGLYPGASGSSPRLLIGSHLDTVPDAGAFDGIFGVVLAISLIESLEGRRLPFAIEILGFSEEEGVRFAAPFIGSRALVGRVDDDLLNRTDAHGVSVRAAIEAYGLNPAEIPAAALSHDVLAYLEFHIEQGPVLEHKNLPLGIVEAIAGQSRMEFVFTGSANHAGTTPMNLRRDALVAAAEWAVSVEKHALATPGAVATVGVFEPKPGAPNVVPGECRVTLDVRHASDAVRAQTAQAISQSAAEIAARRGLTLTSTTRVSQNATPMDPFLISQIESAFSKINLAPFRLASGAGHDAMILAEKVPAAMIFLRSPGGISHNPKESVLLDDVAKSIECGLHLLNQLANSSEFLQRNYRA
jgi:allantoate deiminase